MTVPKHLIFDEIEAIRELVEDTPPGPLKALDAEYEIALTRLASFLSGTKIDDLDERSRNLAERLARHFLIRCNQCSRSIAHGARLAGYAN